MQGAGGGFESFKEKERMFSVLSGGQGMDGVPQRRSTELAWREGKWKLRHKTDRGHVS